jgi:hypothetical protein
LGSDRGSRTGQFVAGDDHAFGRNQTVDQFKAFAWSAVIEEAATLTKHEWVDKQHIPVNVDGVIDQTDRWFIPEGEHEDESYDQLFAADAFVLGRPTYQGLAGVWPTITDDRGFADRVNALPNGDVAEGVRELKRQHSGHLLSYGCGELARYLNRAGPGRRDQVHGVPDRARRRRPTIWRRGPPVSLPDRDDNVPLGADIPARVCLSLSRAGRRA